ncbi:MAG TPA: DUF4012 domain-containing protein, partial [Chloroflexota bacterium]|nr:DUF4012 domain-containing protein [Chloroflexota bacterium]
MSALRALPELRPVADGIDLAREHTGELREAAKLAPVFPELANRLLGGDRPRTYILVGQNNDEVRATGGYWGTFGLLTVAEGRVINTDVRSSDLWDNPSVPKLPAPEPLQKYMNFG